MSFKDSVLKDNLKVFLNLDEFAEEHLINGVSCKAILQDITIVEEDVAQRNSLAYSGVYGQRMLVNVRKDDLPEIPINGNVLYIDENLYMVESVADDMGMLTIQLVANER